MKKRAFTLIEIVMVIVVLGVVAMIGTDVIAHMYEGYIKTKVVNKLQIRTTQVLDLISKRLSYRIKDSAVASIGGTSYKKLSNNDINETYDVLEWIGYDNEGMIGEWDSLKKHFSGWNGFVDVDNPSTNKSQIVSSGSRFDFANDSIKTLSNGSKTLSTSAIIFKCSNNMEPKSYGFDGGTGSNVYRINKVPSHERLTFVNTAGKDICEQYYVVWSAYALVPEGVTTFVQNGKTVSDFNLTLKYDYQPWEGETYKSKSTKSEVLAEHVSTFRFIQTGHTVRFKLCMRDPQTKYGFCKEKAVY